MNEEMAAHLVGVAAPVFNKEGYPRYAVSVAGLCFRPVEAFVAEVCDDVVQDRQRNIRIPRPRAYNGGQVGIGQLGRRDAP